MYSFEPSEEQKMLIDAVNRFATNDMRPAAHDAEESGQYQSRLIDKGWELGVLQASIPEAYGGFGDRSVVTGVLAAESMAWGDLAGSMAIMAPGLFTMPILLAGTEEQKKTYIPAVIEAAWQPYTAALLEPKFDFDANDVATTAEASGDEYLLNGEKTYVPFASEAKSMIVYAKMDGKTRGFILPSGTPGVTIPAERQKLMGLNALPFYSVKLEGVRIPKANILPGEFGPVLDASRVTLASMAVGVAKAAFEYSRDYAKDRDVFGMKVAQKQAIAFMLAEMAIEIEAMRALTWEAAWMLDTGKPDATKQAYLAQTGAADMVMMVTDRAVQILGGHGYIREHPVELFMRNGRGFATFTGLAMV
ncbi:MAG: acyl-CoA dehydrogenase [Chloroflexi bacterium GWB2_49_20]|nr:MAG: acyl-CoA dehydrogenase [Chloroflexi bacterium GWB2_49_20]OGN76856.1 MAG: acyl-CoA dehydrogenase [Chloroflexi bacterium GWC2_49_37]OGN84376.1 MAG: acyl-CoA dehydrogenase [Chloroflexi bacterium GWD2_49_16]HCC78238.1 acyl-CoA dehydrogenase [Anaerolineae bacterium]HCM96728.1 acyl-CoA dehydrogenase [Anaerolineae bacterium]